MRDLFSAETVVDIAAHRPRLRHHASFLWIDRSGRWAALAEIQERRWRAGTLVLPEARSIGVHWLGTVCADYMGPLGDVHFEAAFCGRGGRVLKTVRVDADELPRGAAQAFRELARTEADSHFAGLMP